MAKFKFFVLTAAGALVLAACDGNTPASNASAADTDARTAPAAPKKAALVTLEKSAYEAWKTKDAKFWGTFLSDMFVGYGSSGKLDKASATKEYTGADCEIKNYALSDEQMKPLGNDVALLTYKTTVDGTCGGQRLAANSWAATIYARAGDTWKGAFHAEAPVIDPKATPAMPAVQKDAPEEDEAKPGAPDAATDALVALEKAIWEAWKEHDAKKLEDLTAEEISFINVFSA